MKNIKTYTTRMEVHFPLYLIEHLKDSGLNITNKDIELVRNAVAYDVARKLNYADQGFYILGDVLPKIIEDKDQKQLPNFLKIVT